MATTLIIQPSDVLGKRRREQHEDEHSGSSKQLRHDALALVLDEEAQHTPPSQEKIFECPFEGCGRVFNRPAKLDDHVRSHTKERPFVCEYEACDKTFMRKTHLNDHIRTKHLNERKLVCSFEGCHKAFATRQRLEDHFPRHFNKAHEYRCTDYPPCDRVFRKHKTLKQHVDQDHLGLNPFACTALDKFTGSACDQTFDTSAKLRRHVVRCHSNITHWCTLCSTTPSSEYEHLDEEGSSVGFSSLSEFRRHMTTVHPPTCHICGAVAPTDRQMERHIQEFHSDLADESQTPSEQPQYACPECGKIFGRMSNLRVHHRSMHLKEKPFVCGVTDLSGSKGLEDWDGSFACNEGFTAKASLEAHVRRLHIDSKAEDRAKKREQRLKQKEDRQAKRILRQQISEISTIQMLTGSAYAGRGFACSSSGCSMRFNDQRTLAKHLESQHGCDEAEIQREVCDALMTRKANTGGPFWLSNGSNNDLYDTVQSENIMKTGQLMQGPKDGKVSKELQAVDPALL